MSGITLYMGAEKTFMQLSVIQDKAHKRQIKSRGGAAALPCADSLPGLQTDSVGVPAPCPAGLDRGWAKDSERGADPGSQSGNESRPGILLK